MRRVWKCAALAVIAAAALTAAACGRRAMAGQESGGAAVPSWEGISDRIARGNIYEITENEFHPGLEYDFSGEELECWKAVIGQKDYQCQEAQPKQEEIQYIIDLYDKDGNGLAALSVDRAGVIYADDGYRITSKTLEKLLGEIIGE